MLCTVCQSEHPINRHGTCNSQMASSYHIQAPTTCSRPLLPSVDCAIILTMRRSNRLRRAATKALLSLCHTTYVQINAGFGDGRKPAWVQNTSSDLVHAYMHACAWVKTQKYMGNVLILEDDAELVSGCTLSEFQSVDTFVRSHPFNAYSLGSFGSRKRYKARHFLLEKNVACAQAVIWSPKLRERLLAMDGRAIPHIDGHFLSYVGDMFTFEVPLVVQKLNLTENQSQWCTMCTEDVFAKVYDTTTTNLFKLLIRVLRMDEDTKGWRYIYTFHVLPDSHKYLFAIRTIVWSITLKIVKNMRLR